VYKSFVLQADAAFAAKEYVDKALVLYLQKTSFYALAHSCLSFTMM